MPPPDCFPQNLNECYMYAELPPDQSLVYQDPWVATPAWSGGPFLWQPTTTGARGGGVRGR